MEDRSQEGRKHIFAINGSSSRRSISSAAATTGLRMDSPHHFKHAWCRAARRDHSRQNSQY
jgi:hypothetical protein